MSEQSFTHALLPSLDKRVFRLGLAGNYGIESADAEYAAEQGVNFWLWTPRFKKMTPVLKQLLKEDRSRHVVSMLGTSVLPGGPRKDVEKALKLLDTDHLDVYKLGWLGRTSRFSPGIQNTMLALKAEGKVRALGCSIHDRPRAGQLAQDSILDTFMLRYNAKHPGAERDIFPHLQPKNPTVIAYTATSWQQLLKPVKGVQMPPWPGEEGETMPPLTAGLCYRFCLSSPHVHVCLTGPKTRAQLAANLEAMEAGPLSEDELEWVRNYGAQVKEKSPLMSIPLD